MKSKYPLVLASRLVEGGSAVSDLLRRVLGGIRGAPPPPGGGSSDVHRLAAAQKHAMAQQAAAQQPEPEFSQPKPLPRVDPVKPPRKEKVAADVQHPPGKMVAFHHNSQSLRNRHRPDLDHPHNRFKSFHDAYHAGTKYDDLQYLGGGVNATFHGKMADGHEVFVKPHESVKKFHDLSKSGIRHHALYQVASHMGADHMVLPGFDSKFPAVEHMPDHVAPPSEYEEKAYHPHTYADGHAFVSKFEPNQEKLSHAGRRKVEAVDGEHRMMGALLHVLFNHTDGHAGNVLIHGSGHPILIDNDTVLDHPGHKTPHGYKRIRSVFAPDGPLDYTTHYPDGVGADYPHRVEKTLRWLAAGGHTHPKHGLGLGLLDSAHLQENAIDLLDKEPDEHGRVGMEKALSRRHVTL